MIDKVQRVMSDVHTRTHVKVHHNVPQAQGKSANAKAAKKRGGGMQTVMFLNNAPLNTTNQKLQSTTRTVDVKSLSIDVVIK